MSEYIFKANFKIDNCLTCPVTNLVINCPCFTGEAHASDFCDSKHPNCPLKELPKHGRLIDASAEIERIKKMQEELPDTERGNKLYYKYDEIIDYLYDSPTNLEASKED